MMEKRLKREGSPYSKFVQMVGELGYNKSVNVEIATVTSAAPNLQITLDRDGLELDKDDLLVMEHLTRHQRVVSIDYNHPNTVELGDGSGETVSSRQNIGSTPSIPYEQFEMKYATMTYEDVLKVGDRVAVVCLEEDMVYMVLDRVVRY